MEISQNLLFILLLVAIILLICWLWRRRFLYMFSLHTPGYWGLPIVGNFHRIRHIDNVLPTIRHEFQRLKHHTICIWMGLTPVLLTRDPVVIEKILTSPNMRERPKTLSGPTKGILGDGLVSNEGLRWQKNRKMINPFFHHKNILNILPRFNQTKNVAIKELQKFSNTGKEHQLFYVIQELILGLTLENIFGEDPTQNIMDIRNYMESTGCIKQELAKKISLSYLHLDGLYSFSQKAKKTLQEFIRLRVRHWLSNSNYPTQSEGGSESFLTYAVKMFQTKQWTQDDISDEAHSLFETASETIINSIYSALLMLAMYPKVQQRLFEELETVFPDKTFEIDHDHFEVLPYLNMVCNETLRLMPPVPLITRRVTKTTKINKDLTLPEGLEVFISLFDLHHRKDIWGPNADRFDPEHFSPEHTAKLPSNSFLPFSKGTRNCVGSRYGLFAFKIILAGLVRNFEFKTESKYEDLRFSAYITLQFLEKPMLEVWNRK